MSRPWMPLYVGDFLADTAHLSATETGIYMRLIMHCWQHGTIPKDDKTLARISHCDARVWRQYRETVLQFFDLVNDVSMHHKRVTHELHRSEEISNKRKDAALQKHSKSSPNAEQLQTHARASSQPQSHLQKKETEAYASGAEAPPDPSEPERQFFKRVREVLGKSAGGQGAKLLKVAGGNVALARSKIELAATKDNAGEFIAKVIATAASPPARPLTQHQIERANSRRILDALGSNGSTGGGEIGGQPDLGLLRHDPSNGPGSIRSRSGGAVIDLSATRVGKGD